MNQLAIIIPAYKIEFLDEALASIANQTNKNFNLYIGDDCSPYDVQDVVLKYENKLNIFYTRFKENLGGKDLIAQWDRCIQLSKDEKWIWLFSDDDVMGATCVEKFYEELQTRKDKYDLYHFNVKIIDEQLNVVVIPKSYPPVLDTFSFYKKKMTGRIFSFAVEYIFSRKIYEEQLGFQPFDMAWGSDTATWIKFAHNKGIRSIEGGEVYWRRSDLNISLDDSESVVIRKSDALLDYFIWSFSIFPKNKWQLKFINYFCFVLRMRRFSRSITDKCTKNFVNKFITCNGYHLLGLKFITVLLVRFCNHKIKNSNV